MKFFVDEPSMRRKQSPFKLITLSEQEFMALEEKIKNCDLASDEKQLVIQSLETLIFMFKNLSTMRMTIRKLRSMFHIKTEKKAKLYSDIESASNDESTQESSEESDTSSEASKLEKDSNGTDNADSSVKPKRKGHGRHSASDYKGATEIYIKHPDLSVGDRCPSCHRGNLYDYTGSGFVRIEASPILTATVYKQEKLRCATCGKLFYAPLSEELEAKKKEKWSPSASAMISLLKYGKGFPFYRLSVLQDELGVPVATSTQNDIVFKFANIAYPVYQALCEAAAQGEVIYNDDTYARIIKVSPPEVTGHKSDRTGVFTSGIVARAGPITIVIFFSGRNHAGENLADVLWNRSKYLGPPIQVCDASSRNKPANIATELVYCLIHGRRHFVTVLPDFPQAARHVIDELAKVFKHDKECRQRGYSARKRLEYHRSKSKPIMDNLHEWLQAQFDERLVEPSSSLGSAIKYMLRHWENLTKFLRIEGAPLDSNIVERALKTAILHRKNSYFYRTELGAFVGDIMMSIIQTCIQNDVNPLQYMIAIQEHWMEVYSHPESWLPWNYKQQLSQSEKVAAV